LRSDRERLTPAGRSGAYRAVERPDPWPEDQHGSGIPGQGHGPATLQDANPRDAARGLAGIFFPRPEITLPIELKRELFDMLSGDIARQLKRRKVSEADVLEDFEASRRSAVRLVADANVLLSAVTLPARIAAYSSGSNGMRTMMALPVRDPNTTPCRSMVSTIALALPLSRSSASVTSRRSLLNRSGWAVLTS
jgi:hypothetical protein